MVEIIEINVPTVLTLHKWNKVKRMMAHAT